MCYNYSITYQLVQVSLIGAPDFLPDPLTYRLEKNVIDDFALNNYESSITIKSNPIGFGVQVEFGRGIGRKKDGIIVALVDEESVDKSLNIKKVTKIITNLPVLNSETINKYQKIASYYGTTITSLLSLAIPRRSIQAENNIIKENGGIKNKILPFLHTDANDIIHEYIANHKYIPKKCSLILKPTLNEWALAIAKLVQIDLFHNRTAVVLLPTNSNLELFERILSRMFSDTYPKGDFSSHCIKFSSDLTTKQRYYNYLRCLYTTGPKVIFGTKSAVFAPTKADSIYIWNDNDANFKEKRTPYFNSRECALLDNSEILRFISYVPSYVVMRLTKLKYLEEVTPSSKELIGICKNITRVQSNYGEKLPHQAYSTIRMALERDKPVLLLYPKAGNIRLITCGNCGEVAVCGKCDAALITNVKRIMICPHCQENHSKYHCSKCNNTAMKMTSIGNNEIAYQVGRAFPEIPIISSSSTSESGVLRVIEDKASICVATPGAEPIPPKGYGAIIIMEASFWGAILSFDNTNDTLAKWFYAVSLLDSVKNDSNIKNKPEILLIGQTEAKYHNALQSLDPEKIIFDELKARRINNFPPFRRFACISGHPLLINLISEEIHSMQDDKFQIMGPYALENSAYEILWSNSSNTKDFIFILINVEMRDNNSTDLASLIHNLKVKGNAGWRLTDGKKVNINHLYPVKFLLDPKELI